MREKMLKEYLKTIFFAVIASIVIAVSLCYVFFITNESSIKGESLHKLINNVEEYISVENGEFDVDADFLRHLRQYNSWIQIIDEKGIVLYAEFVPDPMPNRYSNFTLADSVQSSNKIPGYTLYMIELKKYSGYGVLIGCDSNVMSRVFIDIEGNSKELIVKGMMTFLITMIVVIIFTTLFYYQRITKPINTVLNDITAISEGKHIVKHTEQGIFENVFFQLNILQETLYQNEKLRKQWISNISHDIRTPLSAIRGYAEIMVSEDYILESGEIKEFAKEILKSEGLLEGLVEDLRISNNLIDGKVVLKKEKVEVVDLINEVISMTQAIYSDSANICVESEPDVYMFCDRKLFNRSLFNIISNSYIHNENCVQISISIFTEYNKVIIRIEDNGRGVPEEDIRYLFERYYRGSGSMKTQGTGLGLAIAKESIEEHGGTIKVANKVGGGLIFEIKIEKAKE